jgi:hypothetical protein
MTKKPELPEVDLIARLWKNSEAAVLGIVTY